MSEKPNPRQAEIDAAVDGALAQIASASTADELRSLGGSDDIEAYISLLGDHLPLPTTSLGER